VLEHVEDVGACLGDCLRMLKPGGTLVLTTHGTWEDHGCPHDYRRWTADGLRAELERAGFAVERCWKLSAETRALIQLLILRADWLLYRKRSEPLGLLLHLAGRWVKGNRGRLARYADRACSELRVTDQGQARTYLALLVVARKRGC
jgi:hypothetical protein